MLCCVVLYCIVLYCIVLYCSDVARFSGYILTGNELNWRNYNLGEKTLGHMSIFGPKVENLL